MRKGDWCEAVSGGVLLRVQVQPRASRTGSAGLIGDPPRLKIRIAAPPVDGEANDELIRFLRKALDLTADKIQLLRGETSKMKDIFCADITVELVKAHFTL